MSLHQGGETTTPTVEDQGRPADPINRAFDVEHPQALLGAGDMAAVFGIGLSRFYKNAKRGLYDAFKVTPALGPKCYSGILLARYLKGEPLYVPTFATSRKRRG